MDRPPAIGPAPAAPTSAMKLRRAADALEATFLAEMLKSAGLDDTPGAFGGGAGEAQFASFMREAQAAEMVRAGGIGLAEILFASLKAADHAG